MNKDSHNNTNYPARSSKLHLVTPEVHLVTLEVMATEVMSLLSAIMSLVKKVSFKHRFKSVRSFQTLSYEVSS